MHENHFQSFAGKWNGKPISGSQGQLCFMACDLHPQANALREMTSR